MRLKLVDDGYAVLRKFEGRSSLATYLTTVVERAFLDWRNHLWGKWRPSAAARRMGPVALRVEVLMMREGRSATEVAQILGGAEVDGPSPAQVEAIAARLPGRARRRFDGAQGLESLPATGARPDQELEAAELERLRARVEAALALVLGQLPPADRLLVRLRVEDGHSVADAARILGTDARPLYRRLEKIYRRLRGELEGLGLGRQAIQELLEPAQPQREAQPPRPSHPWEGGAA